MRTQLCIPMTPAVHALFTRMTEFSVTDALDSYPSMSCTDDQLLYDALAEVGIIDSAESVEEPPVAFIDFLTTLTFYSKNADQIERCLFYIRRVVETSVLCDLQESGESDKSELAEDWMLKHIRA